MNTIGTKLPVDINNFIKDNTNIKWDLSPEELAESTISMNMGKLSNNGALAIDTGKFTGRAPKDRFIVKDSITEYNVDWGDINQPCEDRNYQHLNHELIYYLNE